MKRQTIALPGISPRAWQHPADKAALAALRRIPGLGQAVRAVAGLTSDRALRLHFLAGAVRVGERQLPGLRALVEECAAVLDMPAPELFVGNHPVANAGALGLDRPVLLIHSSLLDQLDGEELRFVVGHELGHVACGHVWGRTMVELLLNLGQALGGAFHPLVAGGVGAALMEWYRKSELSADRAGLLAGQDPDAAYAAFMKMAGGRSGAELNLEGFLEQAAEYQRGGDPLDELWKSLNLLGRSHPYPVLRLAELKPWAEGGAYGSILAGDYPRRDGSEEGADWAGLARDMDEAGAAYRAEYERGEGPLRDGLEQVGKLFESGAREAEKALNRLFGPRG